MRTYLASMHGDYLHCPWIKDPHYSAKYGEIKIYRTIHLYASGSTKVKLPFKRKLKYKW